MRLIKARVPQIILVCDLLVTTINSVIRICSVAENANAPDDSGIRAKEARCENRTLRRGSCQVSRKTPLTKSARTNGSAIVEQFTICYHDQSSPLLSCQTQMLKQTWVRKPEDHILCIYIFLIITCILSYFVHTVLLSMIIFFNSFTFLPIFLFCCIIVFIVKERKLF